jgi:hypothetical protein
LFGVSNAHNFDGTTSPSQNWSSACGHALARTRAQLLHFDFAFGRLLILQALWWTLAWLVIVGNLVFVIPTLIQCGIAAVAFHYSLSPAFLATMILEVGWLVWAGSRLIK